MKLRISERSESKLREGDLELYSEPSYIGPYGNDGWETDDDDYYNFKQLGLRTVRDVVDFYKDLSKRQIVARYGAYGVLGDIDWNVRHGYWDDRNTQAVIDALDSDPSFKFYGESLKRSKSKRLREQDVEIEVKNKGLLEVPEDKNVDDLPMSHFEKLVKKHGLSKITKALNNLQVWNKNDDKELSKWAGNMIDKLTKKYGKNESLKEDTIDGVYVDIDSLSRRYRELLSAGKIGKLYKLFMKSNGDYSKFTSTALRNGFSKVDVAAFLLCVDDQRTINNVKLRLGLDVDESLKEDYIDGEYVDIDSLSRRYRKMMQSGELDDIIALYHEVGGDFDEFVIEALQRGFSKLDIMCFSVCNDGMSINNFKHRLRMLDMLDESLKESSMYDYYDVPDGAFDMHNDMPTEEDEMWSELSTKQREIINALEELGYSGSLTRFFSKIIGSWTKVYDTDKSTSSGVEITVDLDGKITVQEFVYSVDEEDLTDLSPVKVVKSAADVKKLDSWAKRIKKHNISF